ncbi:MAG: hypothetical protein A0129_15085 [Limnobacter sp. CACIAM 66H1]|uniref:DUF2971 domain-containing protein n=1 Tax=Limnobacter sp. CACIAM 66H1 TaxID=1813033 RepID=UPI0007A87FA0|nr:DUF2971 domain-containing protein [Limnobacter sp. CACIAM 66H1]KYP10044.1 MAG: hypothetical protein A0129_15085 [Limnobacter sp. CACIAM 66H1]
MPPTLYKYRPLGDRTEQIFRTSQVWLAKPATLNDPLECRIPAFDPIILQRKSLEAKQHQLSGFIWQAHQAHERKEPFFTLHGREINRLLSRIKKAPDLSRKHRIANDFLRSVGAAGFSRTDTYGDSIEFQLSELGIFSLSEDPCNIPMWAHYGEMHKGIAIGFAPEEGSELANPDFCRPVHYSDEANTFSFEGGHLTGVAYYVDENGETKAQSYIPIEDEQLQRAIFTKTKAWAYEKEWRYVRQKSGLYPIPALIREVIFGLQCTAETKRNYVELVAKHISTSVQFKEVVLPPSASGPALRQYV